MNAFYSALCALSLVLFSSQALAVPVSLGAAGPANWTVLNVDTGTLSISGTGSINGNVGLNGGNLSDSGTSIKGNLVTSGTVNVSLSGGATISGTTINKSSLPSQAASAAVAASSAAAILGSSGGGKGLSSIIYNNAGTIDLMAGVYNLTNLVLNNTTLDLTAGGNYVFNISGSLAMNASKILDSTGANVLFNITSGAASLSGGSVLDGIVLAPNATFSESGGSVVGEIIGGNISISGAKVQGLSAVPDGGSSVLLLAVGIGCLCISGKFGHYRRSNTA